MNIHQTNDTIHALTISNIAFFISEDIISTSLLLQLSDGFKGLCLYGLTIENLVITDQRSF